MDLKKIINRQIDFSTKTFGLGDNHLGLIDHISKELIEIENNPKDLEEWIDVVILALDGAWRAGYTAGDICECLIYKQFKNEKRQWPDWRTADPRKAIEHIRE